MDRGAVELGARQHQLGPHRRGGEGDAPGVGVEHRGDRQHRVRCGQADHVRLQAHQGVQEVRPVRIDHPFGVAGGAGGVAEAAGGVLVEAAPGAVGGLACDQRLVVLIQGDDPLHRGRLVHALQEQGRELGVGEDHPVLGVVDDPADLVGMQAGIEGVAHRPDAHDPVPDLKMPPGVPGQGRHPVARPDAHGQQGVGHLLGPPVDLGIAGADDRPLERAGDHLAAPMPLGRMVENPVDRQRPALHHSEHSDPPERGVQAIMADNPAADEAAPRGGIG